MKRIMLGLLVVAGFVYVAMAGPDWIATCGLIGAFLGRERTYGRRR